MEEQNKEIIREHRFLYLCDGKKPCGEKPSCIVNHPRGGVCEHTSDPDHARNKDQWTKGQIMNFETTVGFYQGSKVLFHTEREVRQ